MKLTAHGRPVFGALTSRGEAVFGPLTAHGVAVFGGGAPPPPTPTPCDEIATVRDRFERYLVVKGNSRYAAPVAR